MNNFNWCKYWNLANSYSGSEDDAELRDGISRFYYSAFCTSRNFLIDNKLFLNSTIVFYEMFVPFCKTVLGQYIMM